MIPVYKPFLPPGCLNKAHDALDSTWISSAGKYIQIVQERLQDLLQVPYVLPLNNGTSACHLVAKALKREYPSHFSLKQIIVPNNVYVAAWNAFLFDKEYQLIPIDADLNTWNIDLSQLDAAIKKYPKADVLIVHNIGNVVNVPNLQAKYPNTHFVEDNCEGLFGTYNGQMTGTASFASAISFFGNKNVTSGEGGAFITNNEDVYQFAKLVHGQGQSNKRFIHCELGYNYRMTNVQAAILCGQLDALDQIKELKQNVFDKYRQAFGNREDIKIQLNEKDTTHANWMFGIRALGSNDYDKTESFFKNNEIEIRPMFYSISQHSHILGNPYVEVGDSNNAITLNKECFILPSYPELTPSDQNHIINTVNQYMKL